MPCGRYLPGKNANWQMSAETYWKLRILRSEVTKYILQPLMRLLGLDNVRHLFGRRLGDCGKSPPQGRVDSKFLYVLKQ